MTDRTITLQMLQRSLGSVVRRTAIPRAHERIIRRAGVDIDRVEAVALSRITDAVSMTVTELAGEMGVACSTAGRHAANLEEAGWVGRTPSPGDGRVTILTPTPEGTALIGRLREAHCSLLAEALSGWDTDDLAAIGDLLDRLGRDLLWLSQPAEIAT